VQRLRLFAAAGAALVFFVPVLAVLLSSVPPVRQETLNRERFESRTVAREIRGRPVYEVDGTHFVYRIMLYARQPDRLVTHQQIGLLVVVLEGTPDFRGGELRFGDDCVYRAPQRTAFPSGAHLRFYRAGACSPPSSGDIQVRLRFAAPARVALLTFPELPATLAGDAVVVSSFGQPLSRDVYVARVMVFDREQTPAATRLSLLGYVWNVSSSAGWIVAVLAVAAALLGSAVALVWPHGTSARWRLPVAGACAALALSTAYAVVFPPFQAADEPSHFIGLADYYDRPQLGKEAASLAERGHFEEIQFNGDRRFSSVDRGYPGIPWNDGVSPQSSRGTGAGAVWRLAGGFVRGLPAPRLLLTMRLLHAVLFAAAVAAFVALVQAFTTAALPGWMAVPLFLVPTVPYFGTYMSNYAPLTGAYVLFAAGTAIAVWDGPRSYVAGPLIAAALASALAISRSAIPMLPFAAAILLARVLLGDESGRWRSGAVFWGGVTAVAVVVLGTPIGALQSVIAGAALFGLEVVTGSARAAVRRAIARREDRAIRTAAAACAAVLLVVLGASLVVRYPMLQGFDPAFPPPVWAYVRQAVIVCGTFLRFGAPDTLTSLDFWGGFGWLDTLAPPVLVQGLAIASGAVLIGLVAWTGMAASGRTLVALACVALGFVASVAAYAYGLVHVIGLADLHGRYLLGLYLTVLVVAWTGAAHLVPTFAPRWRQATAVVAAAGILAIQTYCVCMILRRYF
jgi:hypothetical protein